MALSKDEKKIIYADVIRLVNTCMGGPWSQNVKDPRQLLNEFYEALKLIREDVVTEPEKAK